MATTIKGKTWRGIGTLYCIMFVISFHIGLECFRQKIRMVGILVYLFKRLRIYFQIEDHNGGQMFDATVYAGECVL